MTAEAEVRPRSGPDNSTRSIHHGIGGVTEIQELQNEHQEIVTMENTETHTDNVSAVSGRTEPCHVWIPWADDPPGFQHSHLKISVTNGGPIYYLWQSHGRVRFSTDGFHPDGTSVPGFAEEGGRRRLIVHGNGQLEMVRMT